MWKKNSDTGKYDFPRLLTWPDRLLRIGLRSKFTFLLLSFSLGAMLSIGGYGYQNARSALRANATQLAESYTSQLSIRIKSALDLAKNDLRFIGGNYAVLRLFYWKDIGVEDKVREYQDIVSDTLRGFVESYQYTFKIRIADANGMEAINITNDPVSGKTEIIKEFELETIRDHDFFKGTLAEPEDGVYVSPIEISDKKSADDIAMPAVHLGVPVVGGNKLKYGVVISTVFAESFLSFIRQANSNKNGRTFYLVDESGSYLYHPDSAKITGYALCQGASVERDFPGLLPEVLKRERGTAEVESKIVAFETIYPARGKSQRWLLLGVVPEEVAFAELHGFEQVFATVFLLVALVALLANRYFLKNLMRPLSFVTNQLQRLGRGEIQVETMDYRAKDEIHDMIVSTHALMLGMERFAQQADAVGQGDFSGQAE